MQVFRYMPTEHKHEVDTHVDFGGVFRVMVFIIGNGIGDQSSNPG